MATKKQQKQETTIKDVECYIRTGGKGVFINWNDETYITNSETLGKLVDGTLKTQKGKKAKSVRLGLKTDEGINNDVEVFLTKKGKAMYFVPNEGEVLITSVEDMKKLLDGKWEFVKMGMFQ